MANASQRRHWPYDEVTLSKDAGVPNRILISSPWLSLPVDVAPAHWERASKLADSMKAGELTPDQALDVFWFFTPISKLPLTYILPRPEHTGSDTHTVLANPPNFTSPKTALETTLPQTKSVVGAATNAILNGPVGTTPWSWDTEAALEFSKAAGGHDPETLFSVARRFHLLNDIEWNQTAQLVEYVDSLKSETEKFRKAGALIARQNHYITECCDSVLRSALPISKNAGGAVTEFIEAEAGHDKIVGRAITEMGMDPQSVPLVDSVIVLMEVFRAAAARNLLAFAMITDIFERSSYREEDPLSELLREGGEIGAAKQMDIHREINDSGGHENVAVEFLEFMNPVSSDYAVEALRLAELATLVIHQLSAETLARLKT